MTTPTNDLPLKPCPFCGKEPTYEFIPEHESCFEVNGKPLMPPVSDTHILECGCGNGLISDTKEKLFEHWNTRPIEANLEQENRELKKALDREKINDIMRMRRISGLKPRFALQEQLKRENQTIKQLRQLLEECRPFVQKSLCKFSCPSEEHLLTRIDKVLK